MITMVEEKIDRFDVKSVTLFDAKKCVLYLYQVIRSASEWL